MIDFERLVKNDGIKIINGRVCDRYGSILSGLGSPYVQEFGWGRPCTEYHFTDGSLSDYSIRKEVHYDEWNLYKGYQKICELNYYGGENWSTK